VERFWKRDFDTYSCYISRTRTVRWHILTSGHSLETTPRTDNPNLDSCSFHIPALDRLVHIKSIKVFKKQNRGVRIINLPDDQNEPEENKMSLLDIRSVLNYDSLGDVALCEIDLKISTHYLLSEAILGKDFDMPQWDENDSVLKFTLPKRKTCYFHFVSSYNQAQKLIKTVNDEVIFGDGFYLWGIPI